MFILMVVLLADIDFDNMNMIQWVGLIVSVIWLLLFIVKMIGTKGKKDTR
ncbi:hydrophobic protein [Oceanobacillus timonensis]|nr:hydrophobic protein [Oceanobacillus timonensis]